MDVGFNDMESYVKDKRMDEQHPGELTWSSLGRRVFVSSRIAGNAWLCHCPSKIDPNIAGSVYVSHW